MSNINVNRSPQGPEAFKDNDRGYDTDYALANREFRPPRQPPVDWRAYAVAVAGTLSAYIVLFIIYNLWKVIYCWSELRSATCQTINDREPLAVAILIFIPFFVIIASICARVWTRVRQDNALANRTNLVLDRFGNPMPADLYDRVKVDQVLQMLLAQYAASTAMETTIAPHKNLPRGLNSYSPSNSNVYNGASDVIDAEPQDSLALLPSNGDDPMIKYLIQRGLIDRSGNSLLVGFSAPDKPHYIELDETGLIALAGMPRVGKSVTALFIAAQLALIEGAQVIICDKHGKKDKGLLQKLAPIAHTFARCAIEPEEIIDAIDYWYEVGANRMVEDSTRQYPPCFIIIDEFTALILLELLPPTTLHKLISGGVEFPGVQCHGLVIGHSWTGKMLGPLGVTMRRATTQRVIHRIDPQEAGFLIDPKFAKQTLSLPDGAAIFVGASQPAPAEVRVPHINQRDLEYVARLLPAPPRVLSGTSGASVASVASVASAPASDETDANDPPDAEAVDPLLWDTDSRTRVARDLLSKRNSSGNYMYSYRAIQTITNLRTSTIVAIAAMIGRGNGRINAI